jgi:hypothetical protein
MAFNAPRKPVRRLRVDTGNDKKKHPIIGLRNDRALVVVEKFFNEEEGKDRYRVALDENGNELRATEGVIGKLTDIVLRESGEPYPNYYLQIKLEDDDGLVELIELGSVFSTVVRSVISCLRSTSTPLYGSELSVKTYPKTSKKDGNVYTNCALKLNGADLRWAYDKEFLDNNYPAKKLILDDQNIPMENING